MKNNRHGQSTPISKELYKTLRNGLQLERERLILDIAYYTGERWGAIVQLQVTDCFMPDGQAREFITFRSRTRKGKETRQCPMAEGLRLRLPCYSPPKDGWLFPSPYPGKEDRHITFRAASLAFGKALEKCGLEEAGISTHGTRHGFITSLHEAGFSVATIQAITGHKSLSSLQRYVHVDKESQLKAIESAVG